MMKNKIVIALILFFAISPKIFCQSEEEINRFDDQGQRHGLWKKYYDNSKQLRYEGKFEHGKEVGKFKFYCEDCKDQPIAVKSFNVKDGTAEVEYFSPKGKLMSKGKMKGDERVGEWITFHKDGKTPMVQESFKNGKLEGKKTTFYPNGKITEEAEYKDGIKDGKNFYYSPEGIVIKELYYSSDKLHGTARYFDGHGNILIEGNYKNDKKDGLWKYYKDGKVEVEETFPKKYD